MVCASSADVDIKPGSHLSYMLDCIASLQRNPSRIRHILRSSTAVRNVRQLRASFVGQWTECCRWWGEQHVWTHSTQQLPWPNTTRVCSISSESTSMHGQVLLCDEQLQFWQQGTYLCERSPQEAPCSEQVKITLRAWMLGCHAENLSCRTQAPMQIYTAALHALSMQHACGQAALDACYQPALYLLA